MVGEANSPYGGLDVEFLMRCHIPRKSGEGGAVSPPKPR